MAQYVSKCEIPCAPNAKSMQKHKYFLLGIQTYVWTYCEWCKNIYVFALSLHWLDMEFHSKTYNMPDLSL